MARPGAMEQFSCLACAGGFPVFFFFSGLKWLRNLGMENCWRRGWVWGFLRLGSGLSSKCVSLIIFPLSPVPPDLIMLLLLMMTRPFIST